MDRLFAGSHRRSRLRRGRRSWRRTLQLGATGTLVLTAAVLGLAEGARLLERSLAGSEAPRAAAAPPAPACPIPHQFRDDFASASRRTGVPVPLLVAMAHEESRMDPAARSRAGAEGLLQIMPATARELRADPMVPRSNVLAGAVYMRRMLTRFRRLDLALSAYNAGPAAVERAGAGSWPMVGSYTAAVRSRAAALGHCR